MDPPQDVHVPPRTAVLLFADGVDMTVFTDMQAAGELPNIQHYLIDRGVTVDHAMTVIPSVTYAATASLLTGLYPGHHGIVGNKWFDRHTLTWRDYTTPDTYRHVETDYAAPSIYECLPDLFSVNVQCANRRGVTTTIDNWAESGVCFYFGWYAWADGGTARSLERVSDMARRRREWPALIHLYFPGLDAVGHRFGSDADEYRDALANIDVQIGKIGDAFERAGLLDRTLFVFVSDHGHVPTAHGHVFHPSTWLHQRFGWTIHEGAFDRGSPSDRAAYFATVDAVAVNGGNRRYGLHLPGPDGWSTRPDPSRCKAVLLDADATLLEQDAVRLAACRLNADRVWLASNSDHAVITRRWHDSAWQYRYDVDQGDPLGYLTDASLATFVHDGWHGSREWLDATATTAMPDVVPQLVEAFDSPRSPDVLLFARLGWDFSGRERGGHGSVTQRDMHIPLILAGPGIAQGGSLYAARLTDVAPTIIEFLAGPSPTSTREQDGISLLPGLQDAVRGMEVAQR